MDTVIEKLERLAALAAARTDPVPLDAENIMARIRGLDVDYGASESEPLPLRFVAGSALAVAAAAAFVAIIGVSAWQEIANPIVSMESLLSINLEPLL